MAEVQFTENQCAAIDAQGGAVLVSAAAGSGKTAVLSERAVRLLTGDDPVSADRLIIVTFTTAAAEEMRRRIAQKLAERIAENPQDEWLRTQQLLLPRARISTTIPCAPIWFARILRSSACPGRNADCRRCGA